MFQLVNRKFGIRKVSACSVETALAACFAKLGRISEFKSCVISCAVF